MKNVYILIYENAVPSAAIAPIDIFTRTNATLRAAGREPAFAVELVSDKYKNVALSDAVQFVCQRTLADLPPGRTAGSDNLIVVPAFAGEWELVLEKNRAVIPWLAAHHRAGTVEASL